MLMIADQYLIDHIMLGEKKWCSSRLPYGLTSNFRKIKQYQFCICCGPGTQHTKYNQIHNWAVLELPVLLVEYRDAYVHLPFLNQWIFYKCSYFNVRMVHFRGLGLLRLIEIFSQCTLIFVGFVLTFMKRQIQQSVVKK